MKRSALLIAILLATAGPARAHGVETRIIDTGAATVEFRFADGTPLAFANATVTATGSSETAATGRTDRDGRYSFFPGRAGTWQVEVRDEDGHVARALVTSAGGHIEAPRHAFPDWLVALSLVGNVVAAGWLGRRRSSAAPRILAGARK